LPYPLLFPQAVSLLVKRLLFLLAKCRNEEAVLTFPNVTLAIPFVEALKLPANICSSPFTLGYFPPELGWLFIVHAPLQAAAERDHLQVVDRLYERAPTSMLMDDMVAGAQHYRWLDDASREIPAGKCQR
jgi:hypothetical protein